LKNPALLKGLAYYLVSGCESPLSELIEEDSKLSSYSLASAGPN